MPSAETITGGILGAAGSNTSSGFRVLANTFATANTTVVSGTLTNGLINVPASSITVASTSGFASSGNFQLTHNGVYHQVNYTSTDGTHFIGCTVNAGAPGPMVLTAGDVIIGGNGTAGPANGTAAQLTDWTRDYDVSLQIGTAGTALTVAMGPTSAVATVNVLTSAVAAAGSQVGFKVPAGWFVKWSATTATVTQATALSA